MPETEKHSLSRDYLEKLPVYLEHEDFILGKPRHVRKYLVRHYSEYSSAVVNTPDGKQSTVGSVAWDTRNKILANNNLCEPILMQWLAFLSQEVTHKLEGEPWDTILADMDGDGTSLEKFIRDEHWAYLGKGHFGVLIEGPSSVADDPVQAKLNGERSYATLYEPWLICIEEYFKEMGPKRGKLKELGLIVGSTKGEDNTRKMIVRRYWIDNQGEKYKWREYTVDKHVLDSVDGTLETLSGHSTWGEELDFEPMGEEAEGPFTDIPFVTAGHGPDDDSVLANVVPKNREHLNKKSQKDIIDGYQSHKRVAVSGADPEELVQWNSNIVANFSNPDAKVHVVEGGDPVSLEKELDKLERDAMLEGLLRVAQRHQLMTKAQQSADSKREDSKTMEEYLGYVTDVIQDATHRVLWFMHKFENKTIENPEFNLSLGRDFSIAFTEEELAEQALMVSWTYDYPKAGREMKAHILRTKWLEMRIASTEEESEAELKSRIGDELLLEAKEEPTATSLPTELANPVRPDGSISVTDAIEGAQSQADGAVGA